MENAVPSPAANEKPIRKRSPVERVIVWGGILILLLVLLFEGSSRYFYDTTLANFEAALKKRDDDGWVVGIPTKEVDSYVKGFTFRSEDTVMIDKFLIDWDNPVDKQRRLLFQFPSLFKLYKIGLRINQKDRAFYVEAIIPGLYD